MTCPLSLSLSLSPSLSLKNTNQDYLSFTQNQKYKALRKNWTHNGLWDLHANPLSLSLSIYLCVSVSHTHAHTEIVIY